MNWKQKKKIRNIALMVVSILLITVCALASCGAYKKNSKVNIKSQQVQQAKIFYTGIEDYEVQAFDTLSKIAVKYIPSDKYMKQWIDDVIELNERYNSTIYSGETIKVYRCDK